MTFKLRHKGWEYKVIKNEKQKRKINCNKTEHLRRKVTAQDSVGALVIQYKVTGYCEEVWFVSKSRWKPRCHWYHFCRSSLGFKLKVPLTLFLPLWWNKSHKRFFISLTKTLYLSSVIPIFLNVSGTITNSKECLTFCNFRN